MSTTARPRTGRPPASERPSGYTRERLLESAAAVFAERGFESASLEAIAEGAGVTSATVYRHFDNKSDLLVAAVERAIETAPVARRAETTGPPSVGDVADLVAAYLDPGLATLRKLCVELHAVASRNPDAAAVWLEFNRRITGAFKEQLDAAIAAGQMRSDLDTNGAANLLMVVIMGLCHVDTFEPDLVGNRRWAAFLTNAVEELLSPGQPEA